MPPPAAQKAMRLLFGTLRLGFLLKNNPFLEKEAAATLQYVGYTSPLNMSGNPAMSVPLYRHHGLRPLQHPPKSPKYPPRHLGDFS